MPSELWARKLTWNVRWLTGSRSLTPRIWNGPFGRTEERTCAGVKVRGSTGWLKVTVMELTPGALGVDGDKAMTLGPSSWVEISKAPRPSVPATSSLKPALNCKLSTGTLGRVCVVVPLAFLCRPIWVQVAPLFVDTKTPTAVPTYSRSPAKPGKGRGSMAME